MYRRPSILIFSIVLTVILTGSASHGRDQAATREYSSVPGGFAVRTPSNWNVLAPPDEGLDLMPGTIKVGVLLSPERLEGREYMPQYVLAIVRERYERLNIRFESETPDGMAAEFADMLVRHESHGGQARAVRLGKAKRGLELWDFALTADVGGRECKHIRLLVSIDSHHWFHAVWTTPCRLLRKREKEIAAMVDSLVVYDTWKGTNEQHL